MLKTINEYIKKALFEKETTETEQIYLKFNGFGMHFNSLRPGEHHKFSKMRFILRCDFDTK